ncbi:peptidylprolyl isomerase [Panacibacter ginsenosidivorans]|uniref:Peptidylprolyl isomerase n=1 Tax=Panacibacter ginsenosidivorans TaxID=1813871 RepID=A0A5B8VE98_9BACT|nr:peptidylprolyl isomerase [Panacibacter ginsenosidivorans]QEC68598.1 peptidylprolyl isomerase [Panacibacter ginsenosidivorans]
MNKNIVLLLAAFLSANAAFAQKMVADKIIAQIGDKIILKSDIDNAIADYKRQDMADNLPPNPECAFLQGQLIQKTLVIQAEKDSLFVEDDELEALLDNRIRYFISQYGSQDMLEQIAGRSVYEIKEDLRQPFKEKTMAEKMQNKILENVKITPTEVKEYYDKIPKDSLLYYESEIEVNELVMYPKANKDLEDYVSAQLLDYKRQVESGQKKFDALARLYTDDPGSKDNGGQYSVNRLDKSWDPTFIAAAFKLKEGQISPVIKSKFGLHIIQMVSRAGDDAVVRHILKIPPVTDVEVKLGLAKLDSLRSKIIAGDLSFAAAVTKYSDDENSKFNGGAKTNNEGSTYLKIDQLDKDAVVALKGLNPGDISKPQTYTDERGRKTVRILYLKTRTEPHRENLKDDYNRVAQRALEIKKQSVLEKWFKDHIPNYYVTIDKEYTSCESISDWLHAASAASR